MALEPYGEGTDADRLVAINPASAGRRAAPVSSGPAAQVGAKEPALDDLHVGVTLTDPRIIQRQVGVFITTQQRQREKQFLPPNLQPTVAFHANPELAGCPT